MPFTALMLLIGQQEGHLFLAVRAGEHNLSTHHHHLACKNFCFKTLLGWWLMSVGGYSLKYKVYEEDSSIS